MELIRGLDGPAFNSWSGRVWPEGARSRVGMLLPTVLNDLRWAVRRLERLATRMPDAAPDLSTKTKVIEEAVLRFWSTLALSLDLRMVRSEHGHSPCCGPSCTAQTATLLCARCRVAVFHSKACQECAHLLAAMSLIFVEQHGRSTDCNAGFYAAKRRCPGRTPSRESLDR